MAMEAAGPRRSSPTDGGRSPSGRVNLPDWEGRTRLRGRSQIDRGMGRAGGPSHTAASRRNQLKSTMRVSCPSMIVMNEAPRMAIGSPVFIGPRSTAGVPVDRRPSQKRTDREKAAVINRVGASAGEPFPQIPSQLLFPETAPLKRSCGNVRRPGRRRFGKATRRLRNGRCALIFPSS